MHPVVALVKTEVEMDVLGSASKLFPNTRASAFRNDVIDTLYSGIKHKPDTTSNSVKADVLANKRSQF
ncbi:hypothetical protein BST65_32425 [Bradyrhizobium canariense]|nr:hypothetical protein BST65_32425 [Bradyrhizobium canariense]OSI33405.1 hypothetical protein BST66_13395 [Bradyrhizobium canariense]OSI39624.1 hypothetical protein BSZ20_29260 [Bradyrhizobium canariense]OSI47648.1 hypothetical protein BST67_19740 [Bradyrhizobium canariense]OSI55991.1 hypothetical protein BSZ15_18240 [Bradyrhizobium canariense]